MIDGNPAPQANSNSADRLAANGSGSAVAPCRIVYSDFHGPPNAFRAVAPDGTHRTIIHTSGTWLDGDWSPTAKQWAVFANQTLAVLDARGGRLPFTPLPSLLVESVRWSPNGTKILFTALTGPPPHDNVYVINADGTGLRNLTHNVWQSENAAWSPDGTRIVLHRQKQPPDSGSAPGGLFVEHADGTKPEPLTPGDEPDWSPDGRSIVFSRRDGLYVKTLGGGPPRRIDRNDSDSRPRWSPERQVDRLHTQPRRRPAERRLRDAPRRDIHSPLDPF